VRRPLDFVAAGARALALPFTPALPLVNQMTAAGQTLFGWPSPDGQPLDAAPYLGASTLRARWAIAQGLGRDLWHTGLTPMAAELAGQPVAEVVARLAQPALGPAAAPSAAETIAGVWEAAGRNPKPNAAEVGELAGWVLAAPAFQAS
jgi:uncharacterized protein (DUF1800 family)